MKKTLNNTEIGLRLREFGESKFDKVKDFAEALEMAPSSLQASYLSGRNAPGAPMIAKLIKLGCDIEWLLLGEKKDSVKEIEKIREEMELYKGKLQSIKDMYYKLGLG